MSSLFSFFLLVNHLRLNQQGDDPVEGWLKPFFVVTHYQQQHYSSSTHLSQLETQGPHPGQSGFHLFHGKNPRYDRWIRMQRKFLSKISWRWQDLICRPPEWQAVIKTTRPCRSPRVRASFEPDPWLTVSLKCPLKKRSNRQKEIFSLILRFGSFWLLQPVLGSAFTSIHPSIH